MTMNIIMRNSYNNMENIIKEVFCMGNEYDMKKDKGPYPYALNVWKTAVQNRNYRTTIWTGCNLQMTVMSIPPRSDVGSEVHKDNDQYIRVEQGNALVKMKSSKSENCERREYEQTLCAGDAVFVPAGTRHNIINIGRNDLKLSSIYAPPHHKPGTVHRTKKDAENEEYLD